jgi:hypothetical protein
MLKISQFKAVTGLQGHEIVAAVDETRPNAADRNIRPTISQIRDYITGGLPIPPPDTEWVTMPTVTNTGFAFDVNGAGVANFPDNAGQTFAATSYTVPAAAADLRYVFLIYARPDGTFGTVSGPQSQNPATPPYPSEALYVAHATITETGGEVEDPASFVTLEQVEALLAGFLPLNFAQDHEVLLSDKELAVVFSTPDTFGRATIDHESFDYFRQRTASGVTQSSHSTRVVDDEPTGRTSWEWANENAQHKVEQGFVATGTEGYYFVRTTAKASGTSTSGSFGRTGSSTSTGKPSQGGMAQATQRRQRRRLPMSFHSLTH